MPAGNHTLDHLWRPPQNENTKGQIRRSILFGLQGLAHKLYSEGELPSFAQKGDSIWNLQVVRTHLHPRLGDLHPRFQGGIAFNSNQNRVKPLEDLCQKSGPDAVFLSFFRGTNGCLVFLELVPLFIWCLMDTGTTTMLGGPLKHKHTAKSPLPEKLIQRNHSQGLATSPHRLRPTPRGESSGGSSYSS